MNKSTKSPPGPQGRKEPGPVVRRLLKITDRAFSDTLYGVGTIGLHLVACTFVGMGMGYLLDWWLGTKPWLTMTLLLFGIAAGFRNIYLEAKRLQRKFDRPADAEDEPEA